MKCRLYSATLLAVAATLVGYSHQQANDVQNTTASVRPLGGGILEWLINLTGGSGGGGSGGGFPGLPATTPTQEEPSLPVVDPGKCSECLCGIANTKTRIIGGQVTKVNQYPWMASLMYNGRFYCGASLINAKYLLTASHCVSGFNMKSITVRLLDHARDTTTEATHIDRKVSRITKHRGYDDNTFNNDIALLKLDQDVPIEGLMRPVCLPPLGKSFTGSTGIVTGWGVTTTGGAPSQVLNEVEVPIMSNTECRKSAYGARKITDNMLCAGYPDGKKDSCQGDSGGPLHVVNNTIHHIVGVVSWGEGCAVPNYPGVYARVNRYITWIKKNTQDACYCD